MGQTAIGSQISKWLWDHLSSMPLIKLSAQKMSYLWKRSCFQHILNLFHHNVVFRPLKTLHFDRLHKNLCSKAYTYKCNVCTGSKNLEYIISIPKFHWPLSSLFSKQSIKQQHPQITNKHNLDRPAHHYLRSTVVMVHSCVYREGLHVWSLAYLTPLHAMGGALNATATPLYRSGRISGRGFRRKRHVSFGRLWCRSKLDVLFRSMSWLIFCAFRSSLQVLLWLLWHVLDPWLGKPNLVFHSLIVWWRGHDVYDFWKLAVCEKDSQWRTKAQGQCEAVFHELAWEPSPEHDGWSPRLVSLPSTWSGYMQ